MGYLLYAIITLVVNSDFVDEEYMYMLEKKVIRNQLFLDRWFYSAPSLKPNDEGKIVVISQMSVGPCEYFEWGINASGKTYEEYKWLENDFYEDESYYEEIEIERFLSQIEKIKELVKDTELNSWLKVYDEAIRITNNLK